MPVTLLSNDGSEFSVALKVARQSILIKHLLEDLGGDETNETVDDDEHSMPIPLPNVNAATLKQVIEFLEHHQDDPVPVTEDSSNSSSTPIVPAVPAKPMDQWDVAFFEKMPSDQLYTIILAANYLDIVLLLDHGCQTVANSIKGLKVEQIRDKLGIVNDFTAEEEEAIRKETEWCSDEVTTEV